jgi:chitodextrinase
MRAGRATPRSGDRSGMVDADFQFRLAHLSRRDVRTVQRTSEFTGHFGDDRPPPVDVGRLVVGRAADPYTYTADAFDTTGVGSPLSAPLVATAPDDQPPSTPTGVKLSLASKSVTVTWAASTDNVAVTGYRIYRNAAAIATSTTTSFTDSAVTQGSTYQYQVVALDKAGNASQLSSGQTVVFPDTTKPSAPTNLTLTPAKASIALKWAASTDNVAVTAYRIYRSTTLIATVASPALSYTNTGLKSGTSYSYHLVAIDAAGNAGAASATVSAKAK